MKILEVSANFTRPADTTAYAAGDLVANSTTAGSVTPMTFRLGYGQALVLRQARIRINSATNTNASFNLHLYSSSPTVTNGDNSAWLSTSSNYLGTMAISGTTQAFSDNVVGVGTYVNTAVGTPWVLLGDNNYLVYGLLSATAAYTPTSGGVFTATLVGECYV
jgi:hypothetical protein